MNKQCTWFLGTIDRVSEDDVAITESIDAQAEQDHAVEAIMKELNNENDVNTEPHVQMIDRGDEDDGIRIIEIDELIQSRVESLKVPDMLPKEENDPRITVITFDVKERLQVICCLDFTEVGCVFACLEYLKKLS